MTTETTYYSAGAGSGKTHTLTTLLNEHIKNGVNPSEIILTTFTDLAASEFRTKAREALIKDGNMKAASELDSAAIGTVHSVAYSFVRKYWDYLNISPNSTIISENNKKSILYQLLNEIIKKEDFDTIIRYNEFFGLENNNYAETINSIIGNCYYYKITDLKESKEKSIEYINGIFTGVDIETDKIIKFVQDYLTNGGNATIKRNLEKVDCNNLNYSNYTIINNQNYAGAFINNFNSNKSTDIKKIMANALISRECGAILIDYITVIFDLAEKLLEKYKEKKEKEHLIDYNDMELHFVELLKNKDIKEIIRKQYRLVMVDEFQDSNPIQVEIFNALAELVETNIWVGDQKQSIYSFRGTDPQVITDATDPLKIKNIPLEESWRSRKSLVEAANNIFTRSMTKIDTLTPHWDDGKNLSDPIMHWYSKENQKTMRNATAQRIKTIVESNTLMVKPKKRELAERPIEYRDIAILVRENTDCDAFVSALRKAGVPVSSAESEIYQRAEVQLVISLLQYANNGNNTLNKLNIEKLFKATPTEEIIKRTIEKNETSDDIEHLFQHIDRVIARNKHLPINYLVKNIILELNLHEIVKKWGEEYTRQQNLNNIIIIANEYDEECVENGRGSSISNFLNYLETNTVETKVDNVSNTVKVLTYHKSKGLEWPMVILDTLDKDELDDNNLIKKDVCSVTCIKNEDGNYCNIFIPKIISSNGKVPASIIEIIKNTDLFKSRNSSKQEEIKRLLYVGFTRARDYVVTLSYCNKNNCVPLKWLINTNISDGITYDKIWGKDIKDIKVKVEELVLLDSTTAQQYDCANYSYPEEVSYLPKYLSPSKIESTTQIEVELIDHRSQRIDINKANDLVTEIGTCLHNIFAIHDLVPRDRFEDKAKSIIQQHNLANQLTNTNSICQSIENLYTYLRKQYGEPTSIGHEVPFYHKRDGQIVHGEIDLIWNTSKGSVLIDFKSFPGGINSVINPEDKHYAGKYAPQLHAYKQAIETAGITILDSLIYYSIQGSIVRLKI